MSSQLKSFNSRPAKVTTSVLLAILLISLYLQGAFRNAQVVNTDFNRTDQGSFMTLTQRAYQSNFKYTGNRNQMPLYSYVQLLSYHPDLSDQAFFKKGKRLNILLSVFFLIGIFMIFSRIFPLHHAWNLIGVTAFSVFIFKAGYFHCSLTYYFFHFISFILICRLLVKPSLGIGLGAGIGMALAYLTKASFLPFVGAAVLVLAVKCTIDLKKKTFRNNLLSTLLVAIAFVTVVSPYVLESKQKYGRYFYNVNSSFYMWYKTRPEVFDQTSTRSHGDRTGWPDIEAQQVPGPLKYLKENSPSDIIKRIASGSVRMLRHMKGSYGFFKYILMYTIFALLILFLRRSFLMTRIRENLTLVLFITVYFSVYFLSYSFYMATGPIIRHVLSLFLPLLFTLSLIIVPEAQHVKIYKGINLQLAFNLLITLVLIPDIYLTLTDKVLRIFGAD
jgi:hypothetical protein